MLFKAKNISLSNKINLKLIRLNTNNNNINSLNNNRDINNLSNNSSSTNNSHINKEEYMIIKLITLLNRAI